MSAQFQDPGLPLSTLSGPESSESNQLRGTHSTAADRKTAPEQDASARRAAADWFSVVGFFGIHLLGVWFRGLMRLAAVLDVRRRERPLTEHFASAQGAGWFDPRFFLMSAHAISEPIGFSQHLAALALPPAMFQVLGGFTQLLAALEQRRAVRVWRRVTRRFFESLDSVQEMPQRRTKALLVNGRGASWSVHVSLGLRVYRLRWSASPPLPCQSLIRSPYLNDTRLSRMSL